MREENLMKREEKKETRKEEAVPDRKNKKLQFVLFGWALTTLAILALAGFGGFTILKESKELQSKYEQAQIQISTAEQELSVLRNLKSTYESSRDRNKEDLVQYISNNYIRVPIELAELIAEKTEDLCIKHGVNFNLIVGIMGVESNFDPSAVSSAHARGLMQVRHKIWGKELGIERYSDLHGVEKGIDAGIRVFKHYLSEAEGNTTSALSRYNGSGKGKSEYADKVYKEVGRFVVSKRGVPIDGEPEESDSDSAGVAKQ